MRLAVCLAAGLLAAASAPGWAQLTRAPSSPAPPPALPALDSGTRLLVVSPHPDDETLCCAGIMQRVLAAGGHVSVVWLTSGDGARGSLLLGGALWGGAPRAVALGERRMAEARAAATLLGVPSADQLFLGYPDGGLLELLRHYHDHSYRSSTTAASAVPYAQALFPGHPNTGASLERDFAAVVARVRPTLILSASPLDLHPDHRAAGLLILGPDMRSVPRALWIVHGGEGWPAPRQLMPGVPLFAPPLAAGLGMGPFALSPAEEDRKHEALKAYASQLQLLAPFLQAFVRSNELFALRAPP
jgi:LmbE family N-acetylglucosaminyl deacetylase